MKHFRLQAILNVTTTTQRTVLLSLQKPGSALNTPTVCLHMPLLPRGRCNLAML